MQGDGARRPTKPGLRPPVDKKYLVRIAIKYIAKCDRITRAVALKHPETAGFGRDAASGFPLMRFAAMSRMIW